VTLDLTIVAVALPGDTQLHINADRVSHEQRGVSERPGHEYPHTGRV
jgi:hypothetical protein